MGKQIEKTILFGANAYGIDPNRKITRWEKYKASVWLKWYAFRVWVGNVFGIGVQHIIIDEELLDGRYLIHKIGFLEFWKYRIIYWIRCVSKTRIHCYAEIGDPLDGECWYIKFSINKMGQRYWKVVFPWCYFGIVFEHLT